jgi:hypothetical protein
MLGQKSRSAWGGFFSEEPMKFDIISKKTYFRLYNQRLSMTTIQIKVSDALVTRYGVKALQERVQREMEWEETRLLAEDYQQSLQDNNIDYNTVAETARQKAWEKFKVEDTLINHSSL